jgi:RNA polymerase sigma factor FliA
MRAYATTSEADAAKRERLIAEHMGMARRIALRHARKVPSWITRDDLVATAMLGLTEAADRYDPTREEPFVAFAERRIRGAVLDELRRGDILPRRVRATQRKIGETMHKLEAELARPASDEEIAARLGVTLEVYHQDLERLASVSFVALDEGEVDRRQDLAMSPQPLAEAERRQLAERLESGIAKLPERDALVLSLYYVDDLTYAEVAQALSVSESRVCQLHGRALARLRAEMDESLKGAV